MPEFCIPSYHCGGHCPLYLGFSHPNLGDGIKTGNAYCMWNGYCGQIVFSNTQVLACPGRYYVYNVPSIFCHVIFSAMHSVCNDTSCGPLAQCITGACICQPGYLAPATFLPTHDSYGCKGKGDSAF
ncbi:adhesion G protein-coupled receptor E1-like [Arapaima gigas]